MKSRRQFFAALAALIVAPKVAKRRPRIAKVAAGIWPEGWLQPIGPDDNFVPVEPWNSLRSIVEGGGRVNGAVRVTYPNIQRKAR